MHRRLNIHLPQISELPARWVVRGIAVIVFLALWPSIVTLVHFWLRITDYRFGIVVTAACLVWLFVQSRKLNDCIARPNTWAVLGLLLASIAWAAAYLAASDMVHQILLPVILLLAIVANAGNVAARLSVEPIACMYLAMPLWDYLVPLLQRATVLVTEWALHVMGIPAQVFASTVRIPEGSFEIAEGCSGKKYFMVAVTLSVLASAYCRLTFRGRMIFTVVAAVLALCANWLRVIVIVVAGHLTNMQNYLVAKEHLTFGSVLFFLLIVVMGIVLRVLSHRMTLPILPAVRRTSDSNMHRTSVVIAILGVLPLSIPLAASFTVVPVVAVKLADLPVLAGEWQGPLPPDANWQPHFFGAADEARASYRSPSGTVEVYLNVYGPQENGRELVNYANTLLAPDHWQADSAGLVSVSPSQDTEALVFEIRTAKTRIDRWTLGYLYATGGHTMRSEIGVQLGYGALRLIGSPASGVVAVASRCAADCVVAQRLVDNFLKAQGNTLFKLLPRSYSDT